MKLLVSATALCFLMAVPTYAHQQEQQQQEQQDKDKQKQQEQEKAKQQTDKQQQEDRAKQDNRAKQDEKTTQDERARQDKQTEKERQDQDRRQQEVNKQDQDRRQQDANRQQADRNVRTETHTRTISQTEFREHFGREHHFHVGHVDNRRFAYGGYNFQFVDAWPAGWGYDDDFYVDYIDGQYYLIDLAHPGVRIAVMIVD